MNLGGMVQESGDIQPKKKRPGRKAAGSADDNK